MAKFLLSYRMPKQYVPGSADAMAAWNRWFDAMGPGLLDRGEPAATGGTSVGNCGDDTRPGGYSIISATDLEAALEVARGCPALTLGAGVEVAPIPDLSGGAS